MTAKLDKTSTDRIEKRVTLGVTRTRVWRAITRAEEFGAWFGVKLEGAFAEGAAVRGKLTIKGYDHLTLEMQIERILPERFFSYRWHPYAVDTAADYAKEPATLVEFRLEETDDGRGTILTIVESGFDRLPASRRAEAFRMNERGWAGQIKSIERYLANG